MPGGIAYCCLLTSLVIAQEITATSTRETMLATINLALLELWLPGATSYLSDSFDMLNDCQTTLT